MSSCHTLHTHIKNFVHFSLRYIICMFLRTVGKKKPVKSSQEQMANLLDES